jgi:hypothetical protein
VRREIRKREAARENGTREMEKEGHAVGAVPEVRVRTRPAWRAV